MFLRVGSGAVIPALVSTVGLSLAGLVMSPPAAAKWPPGEPCASPGGLTLQQQYGYSSSVVSSDCTKIPLGDNFQQPHVSILAPVQDNAILCCVHYLTSIASTFADGCSIQTRARQRPR